MRTPSLALAWALVTGTILSCGGGGDGGGNGGTGGAGGAGGTGGQVCISPPPVEGRWSGLVHDETAGVGSVDDTYTQNGCVIAGVAQRCFVSIGCATGSVAGFVSGNSFEAVITLAEGCVERITATLTSPDDIVGDYVRENCSGAGGGTIEIQRE